MNGNIEYFSQTRPLHLNRKPIERYKMQSTIQVNLTEKFYQVAIASGALNSLGKKMQTISRSNSALGNQVLLVTNITVYRLYSQKVIASLKKAGYEVATCIISDGE